MTYQMSDIRAGDWIVTQTDGAFSVGLATWKPEHVRKVHFAPYQVKSVNKVITTVSKIHAFGGPRFSAEQVVAVFDRAEQAIEYCEIGKRAWEELSVEIEQREAELIDLQQKRINQTLAAIKGGTNR